MKNLTLLNEVTLYFTIDKEILIGTWYIYQPVVLFKINYPKNVNSFSNKVFLSKKRII